MKRIICFLAVVLTVCSFSYGRSPRKSVVAPAPEPPATLDYERMQLADSLIEREIASGTIPGAVLAVVTGDQTAYLKAYGNKSVFPTVEPMTVGTVFDMASCSKCTGTAMSMMHLLERGGYRLEDPVSRYIPGFENWTDPETGEVTLIRIKDLFTHASGLPAYVSPQTVIDSLGVANPDSLMSYICHMKRLYKPRTGLTYSCLNYITLQNILQNITGEKLCDYATRNIFEPLGMKHTCYSPLISGNEEVMALVAPTEKKDSVSCLLGEVHDPLARIMGYGNSGNAGVFSCAEDLCILVKTILADGNYHGKQILGRLTVKTMTSIPDGYEDLGWGLGWDHCSDCSSCKGNIFSQKATLCHTGYTGTTIVIDTENKVAIIFLSNRVHPFDEGSLVRFRSLLSNIVAGAVK
ncbi:MAG: beta-lactamase family protein [Bacteroidales bacterium]|nr:beta-lactamase family protein [Bacteroidales bacterium]